jgi:hypothetical protein
MSKARQRPQFIIKMPPRDPRSKQWREIGAAWIDAKGTGLGIVLEVLPLPDDRNQVRLVALPRLGTESTIASREVEEGTSFDPGKLASAGEGEEGAS